MASTIEAATIRAADAAEPIDVTVTAVRPAADETKLYELERPDGGTLPAAEPGAHIDLNLPNGMTRQYSLLVPSALPCSYTLGIKRDPNSAAPHATFSMK
jgi:vanillate O-demethylase ferredoxin subunit